MRYLIYFKDGGMSEIVAFELKPLTSRSYITTSFGKGTQEKTTSYCAQEIKKILDDHGRQVYPEYDKYLERIK